jgi:hypothetical protein
MSNPRGSTWLDSAGRRALVLGAVRGWVSFVFMDEPRPRRVRNLQQFLFTAAFTPEDAWKSTVRSRFSMSLVNLSQLHAYFCAATRKFFARSTNRSPEQARAPTRGSPAVPVDAIYIGTYSHPLRAEEFLGDLDDVLARQEPRS